MKRLNIILALLIMSQVSVAQVNPSLYLVDKGDKYGYVDKTGKLIIDYQYDYALAFSSSGFAIVTKNDMKGVIDLTNKTLLPFEFESIETSDFEDYFFANKPGKNQPTELYDLKGNKIDVPFASFSETYIFRQSQIVNGHTTILVNGKLGLISLADGKAVLPAVYTQLMLFKEGIIASKDKTNFFIDYSGKTIFETDQYSLSKPQISEGLIHAVANKKSVLLNLRGEVVTSAEYTDLAKFSDKRAAFSDANYKQGYLDENGKVVISAQFTRARAFQNGVASVQLENKGLYGLIDKSGKWIVQPKYYEPVIFTSDRALATVKDAKGKYFVELIDLTGKVIKKMPEVEWDYPYTGFDENGICSVHLVLPTGRLCRALMDKTGKVIWKSDPFDYCFPKDAIVSMPDGSAKPIQDIREGDIVLSINMETNMLSASKVKAVQKHDGSFEIISIHVASNSNFCTYLGSEIPNNGFLLKCTANHPIQTSVGKRAAGDVTPGQYVYLLNDQNEIATGVVSVNYAAEEESEVWNIITDSGNYIVNGVVVLVK